MNEDNLKITLWKENKLNQEWSINYNDVLNKFRLSVYFKYWVDGRYSLDIALRNFITAKDGLNSVFDTNEDYYKLFDFIHNKVIKKV